MKRESILLLVAFGLIMVGISVIYNSPSGGITLMLGVGVSLVAGAYIAIAVTFFSSKKGNEWPGMEENTDG
jgi:hypothetical protein